MMAQPFAEPHDGTIIHRSKVKPDKVWKRDDSIFAETLAIAKKDGVNTMGLIIKLFVIKKILKKYEFT